MDIEIKLPKPHSGQQQVLKSKARFNILLAGRRWGKSLISQIIAINGMLAKKHIAYVTPTYQLSKVFFQDILKVLPVQLIQSANKTDLVITLVNGASLSFFTGERLDAFRGRKFHTIIIDEAAFIPDLQEAWLHAIRPTLTDYQGNALFISTPKGKNYFYTLYLQGLDPLQLEWQSFHFETGDNPYILKSEIEAAKESLPVAAFNQEYRALPTENTNAVVSSAVIEANTISTLSTRATVVFGIDVAKYSDYTVICGLDSGGTMSYFERFQRDNDYTKRRIKALPKDVFKVMDSTHGSLGDGIFESLQQEGCPNLRGFEFTSSSKPKLITKMVLDLEKGNLKYNRQTANELSIFEYSYSSTGYIKYGNAPGGNDDCVIALALANYHKQSVTGNFLDRFRFV